jgi:hypothetical protein
MDVPSELQPYLVYDTAKSQPPNQLTPLCRGQVRRLLFKLRETFALEVVIRYRSYPTYPAQMFVRAIGWNGHRWVHLGRRNRTLKGPPRMEPILRDFMGQRDPQFRAEKQEPFPPDYRFYF